jgi:myosin-5
MLVPSSSQTSEIRDIAKRILTTMLEAGPGEGLDKYQLGFTEIFLVLTFWDS